MGTGYTLVQYMHKLRQIADRYPENDSAKRKAPQGL